MRFESQLVQLFVLMCVVDCNESATSSVDSEEKNNFSKFMAKESKSYKTTDELNRRYLLWKASDDFIKNYPPSSFKMGHNKFSDLDEKEKNKLLGK